VEVCIGVIGLVLVIVVCMAICGNRVTIDLSDVEFVDKEL